MLEVIASDSRESDPGLLTVSISKARAVPTPAAVVLRVDE